MAEQTHGDPRPIAKLTMTYYEGWSPVDVIKSFQMELSPQDVIVTWPRVHSHMYNFGPIAVEHFQVYVVHGYCHWVALASGYVGGEGVLQLRKPFAEMPSLNVIERMESTFLRVLVDSKVGPMKWVQETAFKWLNGEQKDLLTLFTKKIDTSFGWMAWMTFIQEELDRMLLDLPGHRVSVDTPIKTMLQIPNVVWAVNLARQMNELGGKPEFGPYEQLKTHVEQLPTWVNVPGE